ncbi:hypothetical protein GIB67_026295 [Kingdonia uniflora]|uniref:Uncharacterized protein n=1 Tax=Kingdonia uniflora TaxID=39325 RepID=A0A7J7LA19_9MAGN|nr:hypothetical protein GIB67_026295 [Kingdonia uniflora]
MASSSRGRQNIDNEEPAGDDGALSNQSLTSQKKKRYKKKKKKSKKDLTWYHPLYKAALKGDWESARQFFDLEPDAVTAEITLASRTALHITVGAGHATPFIDKLVDLMSLEALALTEDDGCTALGYAGINGNTKAAEILVRKNPNLPNMYQHWKHIPLRLAAKYGHRDTLVFLLSVTDNTLFTGRAGISILKHLIVAGFHDVALNLVKRYPGLASYRDRKKDGQKGMNKADDKDGRRDHPSILFSWNSLGISQWDSSHILATAYLLMFVSAAPTLY